MILLLFKMMTLLFMLSCQNQKEEFGLIIQVLQIMVIQFLQLVHMWSTLVLIHNPQSMHQREIIMKMSVMINVINLSGSNSGLYKMMVSTHGCTNPTDYHSDCFGKEAICLFIWFKVDVINCLMCD